MHDVLLFLGTVLLTWGVIQLYGGTCDVKLNPNTVIQLVRRLEYLNMGLPEILGVVADLESGIANLNTEVSDLIARIQAGSGSISAADADALQARLESLRTAIGAIPLMPS